MSMIVRGDGKCDLCEANSVAAIQDTDGIVTSELCAEHFKQVHKQDPPRFN